MLLWTTETKSKNMKLRLIVIGIIILLAVGAGVLVWRENAKPSVSTPIASNPTVSSPKLEELAKQEAELKRQIAEKEKQKKAAQEEYINELKDIKRRARIDNASGIGAPEGVTVVPRGNNLIVQNEREGYEITVPNALVIADSGDSSDIRFFDKDSYDKELGYRNDLLLWIKVVTNKQDIPLNEWVKQVPDYLNMNGNVPIEKFILNGLNGYRSVKITPVTANADNPVPTPGATYDSYEYYFTKNNKIYVLSITHKMYLNVLSTFKLL